MVHARELGVMAATIVVTCPECKKQLKGPAELEGKRIRCKACGHTFTALADPARKAEPNSPPTKAKAAPKAEPHPPPAKAKTVPKAEPESPPKTKAAAKGVPKGKADAHAFALKEEKEAKNPYQLGEVSLKPRCPQCAAELESEDAVICIACGYNTQTRTRMTTKMTIEATTMEWVAWLTPGIICAGVCLVMLGIIAFLWLILPGLLEGYLWIRIYGSVFAGFGGWFAGRFAFKRLVLNPRPPETPLK